MFEAVLFDWDGTLADTRNVIVASFKAALKDINLEVPLGYIERRIGIGAAEIFREILQTANRCVDEKVVMHLVDQKSKVQIKLADEVELFWGARQLLKMLHGQVKVGLASMNNRAVVVHLFEINGLTTFFDTVLTAEEVSNSKPDPEIFLKTAKKLKTNPQDCVVFEDSIFGVKAAKSAGMCCIAVTTGVYNRVKLEKETPDLIINSLDDSKILSFILLK